MIIAESGGSKSPALQCATRPLRQIDRELHEQYQEQVKNRGNRSETTDTVSQIAPRRVVIGDTTVEAMLQILDKNPRGILCANDEALTFLGIMGRYKSGGGANADLGQLLSIYSHSPAVSDRKIADGARAECPYMAMITGAQPAVLAKTLTDEQWYSGLPARILFTYPPRTRRSWNEDTVAKSTEETYSNLIRDLFFSTKADDPPLIVRLSSDAQALFVEFYDSLNHEAASASGTLASTLAKLEAIAGKLILLLHIVRVACGEVPRDDMFEANTATTLAALTLLKWMKRETLRTQEILNDIRKEQVVEDLVEMIRLRGGSVTKRQLRRASRKFKDDEECLAAMNQLVNEGKAIWRVRAPGPNGGRPTDELVLVTEVPAVHCQDSPASTDVNDDLVVV